MELYLTCDVLILADVFETFRDMSKKYYDLDPAHYISSPGLSQDAMLKYTKAKLELLTDPDMLYRVGNNDCLPLHSENCKRQGRTDFIFGFYVKEYIKTVYFNNQNEW